MLGCEMENYASIGENNRKKIEEFHLSGIGEFNIINAENS